jgi:hypothetical protein
MPKQANDLVLTTLPDDWRDKVLIALAPRATDDMVTYNSNQVTFTDDPRPCVYSESNRPNDPLNRKGYCGSLVVRPAGRTKLPPVNYLYIFQDNDQIEFVRQD